MAREKHSEADVAAPVVAFLEAAGHDVYQEVPCYTGVADIVVLAPAEDWIVEVKATWSLDLLEQARARRRDAHRVFVAVPDGKGWNERADLFRSLGIGTYRVRFERVRTCSYTGQDAPREECSCWSCTRPPEPAVDVRLIGGEAPLNVPAWPVRKHTRPEHKTHAKAGAKSGAGVFHWSEWRQTMSNLSDLVAKHPDGIVASEAAKLIEHHYPNPKSARASLIHWTELGKARDTLAAMVGRRIWFFPTTDVERTRAAFVKAGLDPAFLDTLLARRARREAA